MPTVAAVIALLGAVTELAKVVIASQTDEQKKIMWDRHIEVTAPLYRLLDKLNGDKS